MKFSKRLSSMQESPIRKLAPFATAAKAEGVKVYHLNIGQPDIITPIGFFDAVKNFDKKVLEYAGSQGIPELIEAIRKKPISDKVQIQLQLLGFSILIVLSIFVKFPVAEPP